MAACLAGDDRAGNGDGDADACAGDSGVADACAGDTLVREAASLCSAELARCCAGAAGAGGDGIASGTAAGRTRSADSITSETGSGPDIAESSAGGGSTSAGVPVANAGGADSAAGGRASSALAVTASTSVTASTAAIASAVTAVGAGTGTVAASDGSTTCAGASIAALPAWRGAIGPMLRKASSPTASTATATTAVGPFAVAPDAALPDDPPFGARRAPGDETPHLVAMATDGETYGHHHKFAEMALARVVELLAHEGVRVENFASFLARHPATHDVALVAPTTWSCAHGVERWRSDCGCRLDGVRYPSQAWRTPLRDGLNALSAELHAIFVRDGAPLWGDVWAVRDAYGEAVSRDADARHAFTALRLADASHGDQHRAAELLEMERDALRMFTSCAWFFDDIGGLEPQQVLRYAARAIALSGEAPRLEAKLRATLRLAKSNDPATGTGEDVYQRLTSGPDAAARTAAAAAALVALGVEPDGHLSANAVFAEITGDRVTVTSRDTGRARRFRVAVVDRRASEITCDVTDMEDEDARIWRIPLADFPERPRRAIRHQLRRQLLPRCLTPDEMERLASGEESLRGVIVVALLRAVAQLSGDHSPEALDVADALFDLFEQLETNIPFDVQTVFWTIWQEATAARREALAPFRDRLGFEPSVG